MDYLNSDNNVDFKFKSCVSFAHLVGCVTALMIDYLKAPFPDTFIKTMRTTTEVAYNERMLWFREVGARQKPMLIIDPKFDPSEDTKFLPSSADDIYIQNDSDDKSWNSIMIGKPMISDEKNRFQLYNKIAKYKISFTATFIFDSPVQTMQAQEHIRQNIRHQTVSTLNRFVENNIPSQFMEAMALMLDLPINSDEFITELNRISDTPITHRIRTGNGNKEFFSLTPTTLHTLFTSLPTNNGVERKGKLVTGASFTENIEVELSAVCAYYLRTNKNVGEQIDMSESAILAQTTFVPVSTNMAFEYPVFNDYEDGLKKVLQLNVQFDTAAVDMVNIDEYINGEIRRVYEYQNTQKIANTFLVCKVAEGSKRLDSARLKFDSTTCEVSVSNSDAYKNYIVAIYCDYEYVNILKKSIIAFDEFQELPKK